jgi:hypothetical protein
MTRRKALERWETKVVNCEDTLQALWPITKWLMIKDVLMATTAVRGLLGITCHLNGKANVFVDCFFCLSENVKIRIHKNYIFAFCFVQV